MQITLHSRLFPICRYGLAKVWLHHTLGGVILYGRRLAFFDRKTTPLPIRNLSILSFDMDVPLQQSIV